MCDGNVARTNLLEKLEPSIAVVVVVVVIFRFLLNDFVGPRHRFRQFLSFSSRYDSIVQYTTNAFSATINIQALAPPMIDLHPLSQSLGDCPAARPVASLGQQVVQILEIC